MAGKALDYARTAFDLIDEFDRLKSPEQIMGRLSSALSVFGYSAFLITGLPEPPQSVEAYFLLNGWPKGWTEHYTQHDYYKDDPVAAFGRRSVDPFAWSEAPYDPEQHPGAAVVMRAAEDFGMKKGLCIPVVRASGFHACVSMAGERPDFEPRARRAIHLISLYAHAKVHSLIGAAKPGSPRRMLTPREREALAWAAAGKSSWDISVILGISERTTNKFIANAVRKLDAVNRTQAVVNAIRTGELKL